MQSTQKFVFEDQEECVCVTIPDTCNTQYGMYTWPCAPMLAQYVWDHRGDFKGRRVLELSAGTALPGIVALKCGADVQFSDIPECMDSVRLSCAANGLTDVQILEIIWGNFQQGSAISLLTDLDWVLASDCFFDSSDFEDIVATLAYLLERNVNCVCLFAYQLRTLSYSIENLLYKWNLTASLLEMTTDSVPTIQLFKLTVNKTNN
ncbi:histone-arginine methyltransferase METTL23-like isoform X2 [Dreissena polymorpha]|nr:histone-arginine methyltransferase METTL23-like isoform X2 [Dreissena polymorpha]XP_052280282.1 histone-arginine methyltransferase METTL23-like isoform X2 [Dreissena polymorpha]XP_052280283.1 histone-arginine methyltransferase METTL23-like isoform X2 [Dreissena polymorpha]